ncbi:MAG: 1-acyl-sn-glycerol-3-phosphate acyltransferase [Betaproteobacteria bacterium]|nr:1-acyl-sn-glycerol-3-phosphate acyltransferase [Betaproteobacteria bacterium]
MRPATTATWPASGRRINRTLIRLKLTYEYLVLYSGLALFASSIFLWSAVAAVLYPLLPRRLGSRLGQFTIMALFRGFLGVLQASGIVKCDLSALDALRDEGALIIAPNHPSLLDAVLVASRLPHVVCIMKAEIWDNLILGGGARFAAYIRDDRHYAMIRSAVASVRGGSQLLMFPEGTRTRAKAGYHCKGGFALIAKTARVPVQTVFIETNSPFLGKGWPLYRKPVFPLVYRARLGKRFEVNGDVKAATADLEGYYREMLAAGPHVHVDAN